MNKVSATDANRNFALTTKKVDQDKIIGIEKKGDLKYIMMTSEKYEDLRKDVLYGKTDTNLFKLEYSKDSLIIYQIMTVDNFASYRICRLPANEVLITRTGNNIRCTADLDTFESENERQKISIMYGEDILYEDPDGHFDHQDPFETRSLVGLKIIKAVIDEFLDLPEERISNIEVSVIKDGRNIIDLI